MASKGNREWVNYGSSERSMRVATHGVPLDSTNLFFKYLATSSGSVVMNVAATTAAVKRFYVAPTTGKVLHLYRVNIMMRDGGMASSLFGGRASLTDGMKINLVDVASSSRPSLYDFTDGQDIKENYDLAFLAGVDVSITTAIGAGLGELLCRWTVSRAGGPVTVTTGQRFEVELSTTTTALAKFRMMGQGILVSSTG